MDDLSLVAVLVAALAFFVLGALWYTVLFHKPWAADMGLADQKPQNPGAPLMLGSVLASLVLAFVIEWLVGDGDVGEGAKVGLAVGAALAAVMGQNALYDTRPIRLWMVNAGYVLVGAIIVGVICGAIG